MSLAVVMTLIPGCMGHSLCSGSVLRVLYVWLTSFAVFRLFVFYKKPNLREEKSLDKQTLNYGGMYVHHQRIIRTVFNGK